MRLTSFRLYLGPDESDRRRLGDARDAATPDRTWRIVGTDQEFIEEFLDYNRRTQRELRSMWSNVNFRQVFEYAAAVLV